MTLATYRSSGTSRNGNYCMGAPGGIGELGVPPVAPAVTNAVSKLISQRIRRLPLQGNLAPVGA